MLTWVNIAMTYLTAETKFHNLMKRYCAAFPKGKAFLLFKHFAQLVIKMYYLI